MKNKFSKILIICFLFLSILFIATPAKAMNISLSPATLILDNVLPNSKIEYPITFSLSNLQDDVKVFISTESGEIENWISFSTGKEFIYKKDQDLQIINITFTIPANANIKFYTGIIRINPNIQLQENATASILSGTRIDIELSLSNKIIEKIDLLNATLGNIMLENPLVLKLNLQNSGNVEYSITKTEAKIIDNDKNEVAILSSDNSISIAPFATKEISIEFANILGIGQYSAEISLYKDAKVIYQNTLPFTVERKNSIVAIQPMLANFSLPLIISLTVIAFIILGYTIMIALKNRSKINTVTATILIIIQLPLISYLGFVIQEHAQVSDIIKSHSIFIAKSGEEIASAKLDISPPIEVLGISEQNTKTTPMQNDVIETNLEMAPITKTKNGEYIVFKSADYNSEQIYFISENEKVNAIEDLEGWYKIKLLNNQFGYIPKSSIKNIDN